MNYFFYPLQIKVLENFDPEMEIAGSESPAYYEKRNNFTALSQKIH